MIRRIPTPIPPLSPARRVRRADESEESGVTPASAEQESAETGIGSKIKRLNFLRSSTDSDSE